MQNALPAPPTPEAAPKKKVSKAAWVAIAIGVLIVLGALGSTGSSTGGGTTYVEPVDPTTVLTSSEIGAIDLAMTVQSAADVDAACYLIDTNRPKAVDIWMTEGTPWPYDKADAAVTYIDETYC